MESIKRRKKIKDDFVNLTLPHPGCYIKLSQWVWEADFKAHVLVQLEAAVLSHPLLRLNIQMRLLQQWATNVVRSVLQKQDTGAVTATEWPTVNPRHAISKWGQTVTPSACWVEVKENCKAQALEVTLSRLSAFQS